MNWVLFWILLGFGLSNLVGVGIWHHDYAKDVHKVKWYKDGNFWKWTIMLLLFGSAYCVIRLILLIVNCIRK